VSGHWLHCHSSCPCYCFWVMSVLLLGHVAAVSVSGHWLHCHSSCPCYCFWVMSVLLLGHVAAVSVSGHWLHCHSSCPCYCSSLRRSTSLMRLMPRLICLTRRTLDRCSKHTSVTLRWHDFYWFYAAVFSCWFGIPLVWCIFRLGCILLFFCAGLFFFFVLLCANKQTCS